MAATEKEFLCLDTKWSHETHADPTRIRARAASRRSAASEGNPDTSPEPQSPGCCPVSFTVEPELRFLPHGVGVLATPVVGNLCRPPAPQGRRGLALTKTIYLPKGENTQDFTGRALGDCLRCLDEPGSWSGEAAGGFLHVVTLEGISNPVPGPCAFCLCHPCWWAPRLTDRIVPCHRQDQWLTQKQSPWQGHPLGYPCFGATRTSGGRCSASIYEWGHVHGRQAAPAKC